MKPIHPTRAGDSVTTTVPLVARYSEYGGRPRQDFTPGMVGMVAHPNTPRTYQRSKYGRPLMNRPESFMHGVVFIGADDTTWHVWIPDEQIAAAETDQPIRERLAYAIEHHLF